MLFPLEIVSFFFLKIFFCSTVFFQLLISLYWLLKQIYPNQIKKHSEALKQIRETSTKKDRWRWPSGLNHPETRF